MGNLKPQGCVKHILAMLYKNYLMNFKIKLGGKMGTGLKKNPLNVGCIWIKGWRLNFNFREFLGLGGSNATIECHISFHFIP